MLILQIWKIWKFKETDCWELFDAYLNTNATGVGAELILWCFCCRGFSSSLLGGDDEDLSEVFLCSFQQVKKLQAILKPMMLRRLKDDVEKNLAPKEETIIEVELSLCVGVCVLLYLCDIWDTINQQE